MCFVWISEQTAIILQYSIKWLAFITETECVYCAVRTGSLNSRFFRAFHCYNARKETIATAGVQHKCGNILKECRPCLEMLDVRRAGMLTVPVSTELTACYV